MNKVNAFTQIKIKFFRSAIAKMHIEDYNKQKGVSEMEKTNVGRMLKNRREELALTQRQIALHVGVTESAVSRWESGEIDNMRRDKIAKLAEVLQISPLLIMGAEEFTDKPPTLSFEQASLLDNFNAINQNGKNLILELIQSLRVTHSKERPLAVTQNNRNGNNYYGIANGNFNTNVTMN